MLNIVIFGAPGSGKGTQSAKIVAKYGLNHISTGDVLRGEIAKGTELGKTAKALIDNGQLIPDELMIEILASKLDALSGGKGVIFDGFPRTIAQAGALKAILSIVAGLCCSLAVGALFSVAYSVPAQLAAEEQEKTGISNSAMYFAVQGLFAGVATGLGTGIVLSSDGYILTNAH